MKKHARNGGALLIAGCLMMTVTMGLHPAGGDVQHLSKMAPLFITTHYLGIVALQLMIAGFLQLKKIVRADAAFVFTTVGLAAGIIAGAINGIAIPLFAHKYDMPTDTQLEVIRVVIKFGLILNRAFDYVMIGALCIAVALWSVAIIRQKALAVWLGYVGIILSMLIVILFHLGFVFTSVAGIRVFSAGILCWMLLLGIALTQWKEEQK